MGHVVVGLGRIDAAATTRDVRGARSSRLSPRTIHVVASSPRPVFVISTQALTSVPLDITGDGKVDAIGFDTTGDRHLDTIGVQVDTSGDGKPDAMGYDTTGDQHVDTIQPLVPP